MILNELVLLNLNDITNSFTKNGDDEINQKTNSLLNWAADQNIFLREDHFEINGKTVYRFQGETKDGSETFYSFGRATDRKIAAIKAIAELIERITFNKFTKDKIELDRSIEVTNSNIQITNAASPITIESSFYNSNGWAVDFSINGATERALREALERHILLLTYMKMGWNGFFQIDETQLNDCNLKSIVSKFSVAGFSAGISICQSKPFAGASFGYLADQEKDILSSIKWEQAFYESYDMIRTIKENADAKIQKDKIGQELEFYLNSNFDFCFTKLGSKTELREKIVTNLAVIDLQKSLNLPTPFYAAVVHGGDLLPLYFSDSLSPTGKDQLNRLAKGWGIDKFPERHPIL